MVRNERETAQVLVVDDDRSIATLLVHILTGEGYRVSCVGDGRQALAAIDQDPPDLILLDLDMPLMGGYEVCRRIKQNPSTQLIPVLILTGQSSAEARLKGWDLGADEFLTKPVHCVDVRARCRSLLRVKRLVDDLDSAKSVVFALARAVEAKSPYTQGHAERVANLALALATRLNLSPADQATLSRGCVLHRQGCARRYLGQAWALTKEDFVSSTRPRTAHRGAFGRSPIRCRSFAGITGHRRGRLSDGLFGAEFAPGCILSVADVFDALASGPYRQRCLGIVV